MSVEKEFLIAHQCLHQFDALEPRPNGVVQHIGLFATEIRGAPAPQLVLVQIQGIGYFQQAMLRIGRLDDDAKEGGGDVRESLNPHLVDGLVHGIAREQRIVGVLLVQILHDDQRFGDERLIVVGDQVQSRHFAAGQHRQKPFGLIAEIDVDGVMRNVLGIQYQMDALRIRTEAHRVEAQLAVER